MSHKGEPSLARLRRVGIEADAGVWGVVAFQLSGGGDSVGVFTRDERLAKGRFQRGGFQRAGAEQDRALAHERHDGGFNAALAGPAIKDQVDLPVQVLFHVLRRRRADMAGPVGRGRDQRLAESLDQGAGAGMGGHAQGNRVEARAGDVTDGAGLRDGQDHGQRSRPEFRSDLSGLIREDGLLLRHFHVCDMGDQRVEARAALGFVQAHHGVRVCRIAGEAVDGLGWHGRQGRAREDAWRRG